MPIFLLLGLLASAASTSQDDSVILITGGFADSTYDDYDAGLVLSSTEVLGDSCPVPSLPLSLYGHSTLLTADGLILTCGGSHGDFSYNIDCFALDASSQSWLPHSKFYASHASTSYVSMPTGVYLFSGKDQDSVFLPTGSTEWQEGPKLPGSAFDTCAVAISDSKFLVIGGLTDQKQVEEFDTVTSVWTSWPALDQGRSFHTCMRTGSNVVIAGGMDSTPSGGIGILASTTILSIEDKSQRSGGDMSVARDAFQLVRDGDKLLALGGVLFPSGDYSGPGVDSVEEWNETTEQWTAREDLKMDSNRLKFGAVTAPRSAVCAPSQ